MAHEASKALSASLEAQAKIRKSKVRNRGKPANPLTCHVAKRRQLANSATRGMPDPYPIQSAKIIFAAFADNFPFLLESDFSCRKPRGPFAPERGHSRVAQGETLGRRMENGYAPHRGAANDLEKLSAKPSRSQPFENAKNSKVPGVWLYDWLYEKLTRSESKACLSTTITRFSLIGLKTAQNGALFLAFLRLLRLF